MPRANALPRFTLRKIPGSSKSSTFTPGTSITLCAFPYKMKKRQNLWSSLGRGGFISQHPPPNTHPPTHIRIIFLHMFHTIIPLKALDETYETQGTMALLRKRKKGLGELARVKPRPESRLTINTRRLFSAAKISPCFSSLFIALLPILSHFCRFLLM